MLEAQLARFLAEAGDAARVAALPKAIIGPHAGYVYSGAVAARAYVRLAGIRGRITRVVLIGPSHYVAFRGLAVDSAETWSLPLGAVPLDTEAIRLLRALPMVGELEAAYQREHALEVHVPFLQHVLGEFRLVPIVAGDAPAEAVAAVFDALWGGPETLFVVSTDLSHYLDYAACRRADRCTAAAIERFDGAALGPADACGAVPTRGLLLAAARRGLAIERLDLRNSGDTAGPRDRVVGYGAWALYERTPAEDTLDAEREAVEAVGPTLLDVARRSIDHGLTTGAPLPVVADANLPPLLAAPGAAFVTLHRHGELRGCIGSAVASRPLIADVAEHAFNAAFRDGRFPRLEAAELVGLALSVSVLTPPQPLAFHDEAGLLSELRPGVDGLIIEDAGYRSLFLPAVWRDLPEPRRFLAVLKQKAGLPAEHFSLGFQAWRFRSIEVKGQFASGAGSSLSVVGSTSARTIVLA